MSKQHPSLKAMAEDKSDEFADIQKATYFKAHPSMINFEPGFNIRDEGPDLDAYIARLAEAMASGAYVPPIDVKVIDGKIVARDGHCRTAAAMLLVERGINYMLELRQLRGSDMDDTYHMLGTANGRPLSPLEQGRGFLRLVKWGQSIPEIAQRGGWHRSTVDNGLMLAEAPVEVQQLISSGAVSCQVALEALKKHGNKAGEKLQAVVQKVAASGGKKVTSKMVSVTVPKTVAVSFADTAKRVRGCMAQPVYEQLMSADEEWLKGKTLEVPAALVRDLMIASEKVKRPVEDDEL